MTQTALETIADGMRQAYARHTNDNIVPWASAGAPQKAAWLVCARAALQALREPTEEMKYAGGDVRNADYATVGSYLAEEVWQAMIDAILQEKP